MRARKYSRTTANYDTTIEFLKTLKLLQIKNDEIVIKPAYRKLLQEIQNVSQPEQTITKFLIKDIFEGSNIIRDHAQTFFKLFSSVPLKKKTSSPKNR